MEQVKVETLVPGDVIVTTWHDAAEYRDSPIYYQPGNVGHPGVRRLAMGLVVTNEDGWLRLATELNYFREGEDKGNVRIKNSYLEIPWGWVDTVLLFGSAREILEDLWEMSND